MRKKGFTIIEIILVIIVITILTAIVSVRIHDFKVEARQARTKANAQILQGAYERAKLQKPEILATNIDNIPAFSADMRASGFLNKELIIEDLTNITLRAGTTIAGNDAHFIALWEQSYYPPVAPSLTSPIGGAHPTGVAMTLSAVVTGYVTKVEFYNSGVLLGSVVAPGPYIFSWTPTSAGPLNLYARAFSSDTQFTDSEHITGNAY